MFTVKKTLEIAGSHQLKLPYSSQCNNLHGHNWKVTVVVCAMELNKEGMVVDFKHIAEIVRRLDHKHINHVTQMENCTAENIAKWIASNLQVVLTNGQFVGSVTVQESKGNEAVYIPNPSMNL